MLVEALPLWKLWSHGAEINYLFVIKNAICSELSLFCILCHYHEIGERENIHAWAQSTTEKWKSPSLLWCLKRKKGQVLRRKNSL